MKTFATTAVLVFLLVCPAWAQDEYPKWEIAPAFSFVSADFQIIRESMTGFQLDVNYNFTKSIGLTIDFGGQLKQIGGTDLITSQFLLGPRFVKRSGKATAFFHALIGSAAITIDDPLLPKITESGLGFGLGGGFDFQLNRRVALRAIQVDFIPHKIQDTWLNDVRVGIGIVIRFGGGS